jgi:hypothetical protein
MLARVSTPVPVPSPTAAALDFASAPDAPPRPVGLPSAGGEAKKPSCGKKTAGAS